MLQNQTQRRRQSLVDIETRVRVHWRAHVQQNSSGCGVVIILIQVARRSRETQVLLTLLTHSPGPYGPAISCFITWLTLIYFSLLPCHSPLTSSFGQPSWPRTNAGNTRFTLGAHAQRGYGSWVCVCVTLHHNYQGRIQGVGGGGGGGAWGQFPPLDWSI